MNQSTLVKVVPFVFVVLWASGFISARLGMEYAEPITLLVIRMVGNILLFGVLILFLKRSLPKGRDLWHCACVGLMIHGLYLGGCYLSIDWGMPSALTSLLMGLQPLLTAVWLTSSGSRHLSWQQWLGLMIGFLGVALVLMGDMAWQDTQMQWQAVLVCVVGLLGITIGTLYQKRYCQHVDLVGATAVQYFAAGCLYLPYALMMESMTVDWGWGLFGVLFWLVVVLSCIAVILLLYMVQQGASEKVATVFYLVPPMTALQAWVIFGSTFDVVAAIGMGLTVVAVYLVVKKPKQGLALKRMVG